MRAMNLSEGLIFKDDEPFAEPLLVDKDGRILRFCLRPGQSIVEHTAPNSPFYVVVLQGKGIFTDGTGNEIKVEPGMLLTFSPDEEHSVRALDEDLVFVGFLHGVPGTRERRVGGTMAES